MEGLGISGPQGLSNTQIGAPGTVPDPNALPPGLVPMPEQVQQPKKPPSLIPNDVKYLLAEALNSAKMEAANNLTGYLGDPRGSVTYKNADLVRLWRKRDPNIDPLYEKFINGKTDEEIMEMMYPARRPLIRYSRRTYTEQVEFAEYMAKLNEDPKFDNLDNIEEDEEYIPPQSKFPSQGESNFVQDLERERAEEKEVE